MIRIIADSTNNLSDEDLRRYNVQVAPITVQFGEETYQEGIDIDRDFFYRKIEETGMIPTSSQPSPAKFSEFYEENSKAGDASLVITVTKAHSGTFDSAVMAKSMVPEAEVEVFDSKQISVGTGWMVIEAARAVEQGLSLKEVVAHITDIRERAYLHFTPATLKYLQMSGRVGALQGALGSLLKVTPVISTKDGVLEAGENVRTRSKSLEKILEYLKDDLGTDRPIKFACMHARVEAEGKMMVEQAQQMFDVQEYILEDLVLSLAVHGGPGIVGVFGYQVT